MDEDTKETYFGQENRPTVATEKLFGQCFEAAKLDDGALIPVGGGSIFSEDTDISVVCDFESFKGFFEEAHAAVFGYNLGKLEKWLSSQGLHVHPKLFATLFAFTKTFEKRYPKREDLQPEREKDYSSAKGGEIKLSELFANNTFACTEITALAKFFLQEEGFNAKFFSGDVLWDKEREFSEKHSFIVIPQRDGQVIYDPTNPTNTAQGLFPSLYTTQGNFDQLVRANRKRFVASTNIINKRQAYFGVNNGTNVSNMNISVRVNIR